MKTGELGFSFSKICIIGTVHTAIVYYIEGYRKYDFDFYKPCLKSRFYHKNKVYQNKSCQNDPWKHHWELLWGLYRNIQNQVM